MNNLETIRAVCIKANDDILYRDAPFETIRLADVLLAIGFRKGGTSYAVRTDGYFVDVMEEKAVFVNDAPIIWNLRADSLEEQSKETLQFLADLLK